MCYSEVSPSTWCDRRRVPSLSCGSESMSSLPGKEGSSGYRLPLGKAARARGLGDNALVRPELTNRSGTPCWDILLGGYGAWLSTRFLHKDREQEITRNHGGIRSRRDDRRQLLVTACTGD